ncbi:hypothetical protein NDU88_002461 [Pleurodeles waltl]|uniref:Uncharacterized protein n=1 Tax=Pleurodeles waltl TaxID=8319 RepID=A0AAV7MN67_PLEWA|nr:hypothetical protein NDU88_002461 [Pleurodeles waltl]
MGSLGAGSPRVGAQIAQRLHPQQCCRASRTLWRARFLQGQGPGAGAPIQSLTCSGVSILVPGAGTYARVCADHGSSIRPDPGREGRSCGPASQVGRPHPFSLGSSAPRVAVCFPAFEAPCLGLLCSDIGSPLRASDTLHF